MPSWLTSPDFVVSTAVSLALFVGTLIAIPVLCIRLPADHFSRPVVARPLSTVVLRTILGSIIILAGIVMLVLPGQGIITILVGVSLLDFSWKRRIQQRLLRRPGVLRVINGIRAKAHKPPLRLP